MWFVRFLVIWFLVSTGVDCARGEDIMAIPSSYPEEIGLLGWVKVGTAAALTVAVEVALRKERRGK